MEMLLTGLCLAMLGFAVTAAAFSAATRPAAQSEKALEPAKEVQPSRFFAETEPVLKPAPSRPRVPIEALLLQIENHVRLEQAAAESFVEYPTSALLHSKTISTFVN